FGLQVDRRTKRLEAPLQTVPAEGAAPSAGKDEIAGIRGSSRRAFRLQYGVLLRTKPRADDVLSLLKRQADPLRAREGHFVLGGHRRRLHRQRRLDPPVIGKKVAVAKGKQMRGIVGRPVAAFVAKKDPRHGAR